MDSIEKSAHGDSRNKDNDLLQISMKRGDIITYKGSSFTDYMIRDGLFVVINGTQWIGMYNMDCVEYAAYIPDCVEWAAYIPEDKVEQ